MFLDRHGHFFRTRTRHNVAVARRYLRGLAQAEDCTFESMAAVVEGGCAQQFQHFISCSPWDHEPVVAQIGQDADRLLGGKPTSALIIDESSFPKQGDRSVGVARQSTGRGQDRQLSGRGVRGLADGERHTPIDARLYLPERWIEDPARCEREGMPRPRARKCRRANSRSTSCAGRAPGEFGFRGWASTAVMARSRTFCGDWTTRTRLSSPTCIAINASGRRSLNSMFRLQAGPRASVEEAEARNGVHHRRETGEGIPPEDWTRCILRDCTRGQLRVDITTRRIWVWDGKEERARCWHLIVRREVGSVKTIKCSLSNASADTPRLRLAQMQGQRYWVERAFEDAEGECGLADYQALGWRPWHHHVTMVMLAMLFIVEQRVAQQPGLELLTPRDIVEMLKETLPRKPEGREALVARINERHARRRGAIRSRFRNQHKRDSG